MKIVMLGHSSAGKTTYVSLMYDIMRAGIEGFTLRTEELHDHRALMSTARAIRSGRYPEPSHQRACYDLVLQHNGDDVFPFTWRDYRGGALREKSVDSPQARELYADLKEADAILLFADAQRLATRPSAAEARMLVTHVMRALGARDDALVPIVVVFTKCDLVDLGDDDVDERIIAPFRRLLEAADRSDNALGLAVPVVCGPEPVNVELPVLTCLCIGLLSRVHALGELVRHHSERAESFDAKDTLVDRFTSWWNDEPSYAELAQRQRRMALYELERLEPLIEPAERLQALLQQALESA